MSNTFDLAVGVSQNGLNRVMAQIFASMPAFLSGSWSGSFEGASYSASWNLTSAPTVILSGPQAPTQVTFHLELPTSVALGGGGISTTVPVTFLVACTATVTGGTVTFAVGVVAAVAIGDPNPVVHAIVNNFLLRAVQQIVNGFVTTITIPGLSVAGVGFSPPAIAIVTPAGGTPALIGVVNASATTPLPPDPVLPWPANDFFSVVDQNVVQGMVNAAFASSATSFSGSGGSITFGNGLTYTYAFGLQPPSATVNLGDSPTVSLACVLGGSVNCRVEVIWIPTNVPIAMSTSPSPVALTMALSLNGNTISFKSEGPPSFQITATPVGSFGANILGEIILEVIDPLIRRAAPIIGAFLSVGVDGAISIPSASVTVNSETFTATPSFLSLGSFQAPDAGGTQGLLLGGDVTVTVSRPVEVPLALAS